MTKKKGMLQKISFASGLISFLLAFIAGIMLYLRVKVEGSNNPISASLLATTFFFVCIGIVLTVMGKADIPNLKFDNPEDK